jgi:hypothetical protein
MAELRALREADIKVYASVLMNNSVSLEEKAVALNDLFQIFYNQTSNNAEAYKAYGLGVYFRDNLSDNVETTRVPAVEPAK